MVLKRIGAIVAGFFTGAVLSLGVDQILHVTGIYPPWGQDMSGPLYALATGYRFVFNIVGCYVAARLAPVKPMWHAMFIGWLGLVLSVLGTFATWKVVPSMEAHVYGVVVTLMSPLCAWLGGKIQQMGHK